MEERGPRSCKGRGRGTGAGVARERCPLVLPLVLCLDTHIRIGPIYHQIARGDARGDARGAREGTREGRERGARGGGRGGKRKDQRVCGSHPSRWGCEERTPVGVGAFCTILTVRGNRTCAAWLRVSHEIPLRYGENSYTTTLRGV